MRLQSEHHGVALSLGHACESQDQSADAMKSGRSRTVSEFSAPRQTQAPGNPATPLYASTSSAAHSMRARYRAPEGAIEAAVLALVAIEVFLLLLHLGLALTGNPKLAVGYLHLDVFLLHAWEVNLRNEIAPLEHVDLGKPGCPFGRGSSPEHRNDGQTGVSSIRSGSGVIWRRSVNGATHGIKRKRPWRRFGASF